MKAAGGAGSAAAVVPCKPIEEMGYPSLLNNGAGSEGMNKHAAVGAAAGAGKRLWSINYRLLNCTARPVNTAEQRVCACVPDTGGGGGGGRAG